MGAEASAERFFAQWEQMGAEASAERFFAQWEQMEAEECSPCPFTVECFFPAQWGQAVCVETQDTLTSRLTKNKNRSIKTILPYPKSKTQDNDTQKFVSFSMRSLPPKIL